MVEESSMNLEGENSQTSPFILPDIEINMNQRLCSTLLSEFNHLPWSRAMSLALRGRGKLGFINGAIEVPKIATSAQEA